MAAAAKAAKASKAANGTAEVERLESVTKKKKKNMHRIFKRGTDIWSFLFSGLLDSQFTHLEIWCLYWRVCFFFNDRVAT